MDKVFENVSLLQRCYSPESISRCRQRPSFQDKKLFPARFEDKNGHSDMANGPVVNLDVRTVDQGIIDMASKLYTFFPPKSCD